MNLKDAKAKAKILMKDHGLDSWSFGFDNARRRAGRCSYRDKSLQLSRPFVKLNDEVRVVNTILHEIAHALCPPRVGHGQQWKITARAIGCTAERCTTSISTNSLPHKWEGVCQGCGFVYKRDQLRKSSRSGRCGTCSSFITWERKG